MMPTLVSFREVPDGREGDPGDLAHDDMQPLAVVSFVIKKRPASLPVQ